jgi:hypothetical protein
VICIQDEDYPEPDPAFDDDDDATLLGALVEALVESDDSTHSEVVDDCGAIRAICTEREDPLNGEWYAGCDRIVGLP